MRDDMEVIASAQHHLLQRQQNPGSVQLRGSSHADGMTIGGDTWALSALDIRLISEELGLPLFVH